MESVFLDPIDKELPCESNLDVVVVNADGEPVRLEIRGTQVYNHGGITVSPSAFACDSPEDITRIAIVPVGLEVR